MALLETLADAAGIAAKRDAMFSGEAINFTEGRAVLHAALRHRTGGPDLVDGQDVMPDVNAVLPAMGKFAAGIPSGSFKGATGTAIHNHDNLSNGGPAPGPAGTAHE